MLARRRVRPNFIPDEMAGEVGRLRAILDRGDYPVAPDELILIGRRQRRASNSWLRNLEQLAGEECQLLVHPDDASARGIADGATVRVRSSAGDIAIPVKLSSAMMPGVVSLPHGWGRRGPGASFNDLTDDRNSDAVTGTAQLSGIPVTVEPADQE